MRAVQVSIVQMCSGAEVDDNLSTIERLLAQQIMDSPDLIVLPEMFAGIGRKASSLAKEAAVIRQWMSTLATTYHCWLIGGTTPYQPPSSDKCYASCFAYDPLGKEVCRYDKIHLFDVDIRDEKGTYRESDDYQGGDQLSLLPMDKPVSAPVGLSVCYDLRFPELYRQLVSQGAYILSVPSAFTYTTGKAHWETLLRARAIENQCFIVAPNQGGIHPDGRRTWGHSMIVSPQGDVLAQGKEQPAVVSARLDIASMLQARVAMPCLSHRKQWLS